MDVIILTGTDVGVNHREASKIWWSLLPGFISMCCGVKKMGGQNLASQAGKGIT